MKTIVMGLTLKKIWGTGKGEWDGHNFDWNREKVNLQDKGKMDPAHL